ncbi:hypothetical protein LCGC14_0273400 [marine sediment metagenome]|uniref:HK97 gp10 family phage protein n=2 Tax=root TaxID=1 RepID=A0A9C9NGH8_9HYPH|nr:HK97 gp10 family phage protein [Aurantimonas coralicida]
MLTFEFVDEGLAEALRDLPQNVAGAIEKTVRDTTARARNIAKFKTPVDSTKAINGWRIRFEENGQRGVFFNEVPYINVLEFGGYPVRRASAGASPGTLRRGRAVLGGLPPGPRTQRAPGGEPPMRSNVSKQAPRGMVRFTLQEIEPAFLFDLSENIDQALVA